MINNLYTQNTILGKALEVTTMRNEVMSSNIANADTPGYKRKEVKFEEVFQQAVYSKGNNRSGLDLSSIEPWVEVEDPGYNYRLDENNVDVDREMTELYKNGLRHDVITQSVTNNSKRRGVAFTLR